MKFRRFQILGFVLIIGLSFVINWSFLTGGQIEEESEIQQLISMVQNLEAKVDQLIENQTDTSQLEFTQDTFEDFLDGPFLELQEKIVEFETDIFDLLDEFSEIFVDICIAIMCPS